MKKYLLYPLFIAITSWIAVKAFHREPKVMTPPPTEPSPQVSDAVQPHEVRPSPAPAVDGAPPATQMGVAHETSSAITAPNASVSQETEALPDRTMETRPRSDIHLRLQQSYSLDAESGVKRILQEELKVDDLPALIKDSQHVRGPDSPAMQALQGNFAGQLDPSPFHDETWDIETELHWTDEGGGRFRSDYQITASSLSKGRFCNTTGTGAARAFRTIKDAGLLLEISPDMFIHAFHLPDADVLSGNFYSVDDSGKTRYHGPIILKRR